MNCRLLCFAFLVAKIAAAYAVSPELAALQQQYAFAVAERVTIPYDVGVEALNAKFLTALSSAGDEAKKAGSLPEVLAIEEDKKRITGKRSLPDKDDETTPASLKKLRSVYRAESAKLAQQHLAAQAALLPSYTAKLKELESTLTKGDRLEEAKEVMQYREGLGTLEAPLMAGSHSTNSLGMKLVKVPDTDVLFCVHETRRQDYAAYAADVSGVNDAWKTMQKDGVTMGDRDDHPVVGVSWEDARKFCEWLGKREGKIYRLPTDEEWSIAVGLGRAEKRPSGITPQMLSGKETTEFPWGGSFPPRTKDKAGNFGGIEYHEKFPTLPWLEDYSDGFATTSPVMSFKPNKLGLYDMGGNVWEWVADWWDAAQKDRVLRGASYYGCDRLRLLSSYRFPQPPSFRGTSHGFRCVMVMR
ncbi:SUMF1/EgtB/PvdO family nonheme iron enzyme [Prosthecobacter sp.]|uniref:formylglycine-generating enzyme family protein n=1 Tax=Prosthecobacter sp. TaxID=1965333 RepID=UPI002AB99245|nr:SUMF1/EgtB/PvdO family nonheme iron enzyme [Prosthecobacter sp.]MDZ4401138.1 SUMF1/EgtB/PvdO family nonheme iron enzyme [Prosthecobacter sp.]